MTAEGELLWEPDADRVAASRVTGFARWLGENAGVGAGVAGGDYEQLRAWSVENLDGFWTAFASWYGVRWHDRPTDGAGGTALADATMPGASWFPGGTLNYAEHALFPPVGVADDDVAVLVDREDADRDEDADQDERVSDSYTWARLRAEVASVRSALVEAGVGVGDRVAALVPNCAEALVAMLATVSLGGVWSSCSPDFGVRAVADRFVQIEPVVLVAVDGYRYGGRTYDVTGTVETLRSHLPTLRATVLVPYLDAAATLPDSLSWPQVIARPGELAFVPVPFDAPMWILYSSGTTGLPKAIVHCQGGILVEHAKQLALHLDLGHGDRFFWFSTTGWMMWNLLVSGLVVGATIVLFDGNPGHPDLGALWRLGERRAITCFGVSAPYLQACMKADVHPSRSADLSSLRTVGSTGAPLSPEGYAWVYAEVGADLALNSLSGGTDVCTAFVGGAPTLPVRAGEIASRMLGCAVEAWDDAGHPLVDEVGELVITAPMPSMPVAFWGDADGSRLREAYFETYPGTWRHGDWLKVTGAGACVIYGRSDSTLNRGGVRMGSAEFYRVVEESDGVADSLVIDTSGPTGDGQLLLFVVLAEGSGFEEVRDRLVSTIRAALSPRHVPDAIEQIAEVPRTLNGKKCEVPVKRVLAGVPLEQAVSSDALQNPTAMAPFVARVSA